MLIIVYRSLMEDAKEKSIKMYRELCKIVGFPNVIFDRDRMYIDVCDIRINFYYGNIDKMAGLKPDFYTACSQPASNFLNLHGGIELSCVGDVFDFVKFTIERDLEKTKKEDTDNKTDDGVFVAIKKDGGTFDNLGYECNNIELKDNGILFTKELDEEHYLTLAFYTYDAIAGAMRTTLL